MISKDVKALFDPNDTAPSKKIGNLVSGACVTLKTVQKDLVVELLVWNFLSNSLDHSNYLGFISVRLKKVSVGIPFFIIVCRANFDILCKNSEIRELDDVGAENAL